MDVLGARMTSLLLREHPRVAPTSVADVVGWFGAMQAQDVGSGLWSLGARLPGHTRADVISALERREALRTWPMRGTVHLVPPRHAHWMLEVMGSRALANAARRREQIGLSDADAERAVELLGAALTGGRRLTRRECLQALVDGGMHPQAQRGYHLLWYASQQGVTCMAPEVDGEQTFVLLADWAPDPVRPERDEALAMITHWYVRSHGPVTRHDLQRWTGLTMTDARRGLAVAADRLAQVDVEGVGMYVDPEVLDAPRLRAAEWHTLPGFDELVLGYRDKAPQLAADRLDDVVPGGNGIFRSTLVRAGRVVGTWRRTLRTSSVRIDVACWETLGASPRRAAEKRFGEYARYLDLEPEIRWVET